MYISLYACKYIVEEEEEEVRHNKYLLDLNFTRALDIIPIDI